MRQSPLLPRQLPPIDREQRACDLAGLIARQKGEHFGDVAGFAHAVFQFGHIAHDERPVDISFWRGGVAHGGVHMAGADGVDAHALGCEFDGEALGDRRDTMF